MASSDQQADDQSVAAPPTQRKAAEFHVFGRVQRYGPSKYAVVVESFPTREGRDRLPLDVLAEMCPTVLEARDALRRLTVTLGTRIRGRGGEVVTVETNDETWEA
jgi:hypothetical protein